MAVNTTVEDGNKLYTVDSNGIATFAVTMNPNGWTQYEDYWYYYEKRDNLKEHFLDDYVKVLKEYPKELIFTPKDDAHLFFQEFNSIITYNDDGTIKEVRRITSEKDGYEGPNFGEENLKDSFGYGYNDYVLKKHLRR